MSGDKTKAGEILAKAEELIEQVEELLEDLIDLEEYSKCGHQAPRAKRYRFKVNEKVVVWERPVITGREALVAAGLVPAEKYILRLKVRGQKPEIVNLDDPVDLLRPGVEKFRAIERGQGEGEVTGRRDAPASDQDAAFLDTYGLNWDIVVDGSIWVILYDYPLPAGYTERWVTLAIRMESGYPFAQLDMMYVHPPVARTDGREIRQANVMQTIEGKDFQRWSRHRTAANPWVPGEDCLETHLYLVEEFFIEELLK